VPLQTLNRWEGYSHQLLWPVIAMIRRAVLSPATINLDDTGLLVRDTALQGTTRRGHLWVFEYVAGDPGERPVASMTSEKAAESTRPSQAREWPSTNSIVRTTSYNDD
jgi:hypothetical protein